jgi:hypothetical protein
MGLGSSFLLMEDRPHSQVLLGGMKGVFDLGQLDVRAP